MANFGGRRAPNVSQYITNLNTIPSEFEVATQQEENYSLADDLATFTNAEFFDFDPGNGVEASVEYDPSQEARVKPENVTARKNSADGLGFVSGDYTFPEIDNILHLDTTTNTTAFPLQTTYPPQQNLPNPYNTTTTSPPFNPIPYPGTKRQVSSPAVAPSPSNFEDASYKAAEEDKRRRNTAASARFRVKKKQREQALERTTKDLSEKADALQLRIGQLETENEWLRKLVIEKNGQESFEEQWGRFSREADRIAEETKKGVGTEGV